MDITVYGRSTPDCVYCKRAKQLLETKGLPFVYKDYANKEWLPEVLTEELGFPVTTIPVVVIDGKHIGGFNELYQFLKTI